MKIVLSIILIAMPFTHLQAEMPRIKNGRQYYHSLIRVMESEAEPFQTISQMFPGLPESSDALDLISSYDVYVRLAAYVCNRTASERVVSEATDVSAVRLRQLFLRFTRREPTAEEINLIYLSAASHKPLDQWFSACLTMALTPEFIFIPRESEQEGPPP